MKLHLLLLLFLVNSAAAQVVNPEFDKLAKKFDAGKFESTLESAESLIDNDKHRKKPEPYLWASMCFYELSKSEDPKIMARYKSALRSSLKHAGKAATKDKNGNFVTNNQAYYDELKNAGIAFAENQKADDNYRKAAYTYKQILKFANDDQNVRFLKAIVDIRMNNYAEAERELEVCFPLLTESYKDLDYKPDPVSTPPMKVAIGYYIDHLVENSYLDSARNVVFAARLFFPLDKEINKRFEELK